MKKRFRDENGKLALSLEELAKQTRKEALSYYKVGKTYMYHGDNELYEYIKKDGFLAYFKSLSGDDLIIPIDNLGSFIPGVASYGMELELVKN